MATKVVLMISGGVLNAVCTNTKNLDFHLVDFDNLEADPNEDCNVGYPVNSLEEFRSAVRDDVEHYPGIGKLISLLTVPD